jgi:hypothetical protein
MKLTFGLSITLAGSIMIFALQLNSCTSNANTATNPNGVISYTYDVRPILSDKCFKCHGPDGKSREAGLRLDLPAEAYKALTEHPDKFALVPGNAELSEVYQRISTEDTNLLMPMVSSKLPRLTSDEVKIIKKWIEQGAKYEKHWAFVAPTKQPIPDVKNSKWPANEIDFFVLSKMEAKGLSPNEPAEKERLLKRLQMDLTGILPTPAETNAFLEDKSANAYEKKVDELLARPQYGEKMAVSWLDIARYADSHGYQDDNYRSQWPWRDWVIHALNKNMPYSQFVTWQLAGDLLPNPTKEQFLATGFNRNHKITEEGGVIDEEYRLEYVSDRSTTFGRAMLAMTFECAKCHDHKYDPISQKNYYQLFAFFNSVKEVGLESTVGGPETFAKHPRMLISRHDIDSIMPYINKSMMDTNKLEVSVMTDLDTARKTFVLARGNYASPTDEVYPSTPESILSFNPTYPKNRLGLSQWLFDKNNTLTARVYVNRIWQEFFGRGLVKSSADFGMQGDLPTHPALLDWLAIDFRDNGWNIKRLVKQIVMTATYQQSSKMSPEKIKIDPLDIYLSYAPRVRYSAEFIRDIILSSSGLMNTTIGGPSVKPYQPPGLWELATSGRGLLRKYTQDTGQLLYRRGMYTFIKRTVPPPSMMMFDASNRDECQVNRYRTNTPLQALIMLNDPTVLEASKALADKLLQKTSDEKEVVQMAFQRILCRKANTTEVANLLSYLQETKKELKTNKTKVAQIIAVGNYAAVVKNSSDLAATMQMIQVIYNMQEAITKT